MAVAYTLIFVVMLFASGLNWKWLGGMTAAGLACVPLVWAFLDTYQKNRILVIFDPDATWKKKEVYNFTAKELQVPVFQNGELVYDLPSLEEIRSYCAQQLDTLWDEVKRFENPHRYYVDLSQKLWDTRSTLLKKLSK